MRVALRRLLRPGWLLGLLLVGLFAYSCFSLLAPWQLGKSDRLDERNARLTESVSADPVPVTTALADPSWFRDREWRRVTADGRWVPGSEVLVRNRSVDGAPVYEALATLRVHGEPGAPPVDVLVDRGYVPVGESGTVPTVPAPPSGTVSVTARLRAPEVGPLEPAPVGGVRTVRTVDPVAVGRLVDADVLPSGYLQLTGEQAGSLQPLPVPAVENGPYLSYGLQWIAFGILAPLALAYFAWNEIRQRRAARGPADRSDPDLRGSPLAEAPTAPGAVGTGEEAERPPDPAEDPGPADPGSASTARDVVADRYGTRFEAERRRARRRQNRLG